VTAGERAAPVAPAPERSAAATAALVVAVVSGAMVAAQQRVNGQLGVELADALLAAVVSFGTGLVAVALVVLGRPAARRAVAAVRTVPWWTRLGGLGGASLVAAGAAATPRIGVALFTVGLVAGQTAGGLVVDRLGLAPGGAHLLTPARLAGAALCLVAVGIGALGRDARLADPLLLAAVIGAGFLIALQQALNGRVRLATGHAGAATLVNFVVGTSALVAVYAVAVAVRGLPAGGWPGADQWYLYLGGPIGASFVAMAAIVVRQLGVLRLGLAVIAGQLVGALLLDLALPATEGGIATATVLGAVLTLVAVAVSGRGVRRA
jgi:bacterial/archaeal transporter family-2 protein